MSLNIGARRNKESPGRVMAWALSVWISPERTISHTGAIRLRLREALHNCTALSHTPPSSFRA
jgi:hypothetical protein